MRIKFRINIFVQTYILRINVYYLNKITWYTLLPLTTISTAEKGFIDFGYAKHVTLSEFLFQ